MTDAPEMRSERIDLRMTADAKRTLEQAATASNKTLGDFLVDTGLDAAMDALADRRTFQLDDKRWNEFMVALDAPPESNPALRRLLVRKPAWEK